MADQLDALSLQFYRGIGAETQRIGPFSQMNLFIGANNAGKSTVLNFIRDRLPFATGIDWSKKLEHVEEYKGAKSGRLNVAVGLPPERVLSAVNKVISAEQQVTQGIPGLFSSIVDKLTEDGFVWVVPQGGRSNATLAKPFERADFVDLCGADKWRFVWNRLCNKTGGSLEIWVPEVIHSLIRMVSINFPEIAHIPAERDLGEKGDGFSVRDDKPLILDLAELERPSLELQDRNKELFAKINVFVHEVTGKDAFIEIPFERNHILVKIDNKVLPLSSLGTGIQEVILIATFCTLHDDMVICMEEPEIHLHPVLQRKLINYLQENTNNQYFIATHSAAFIDTPEASIFRVANDGDQTRISSAAARNEKKQICDDLGYRASDILQSNAVVWVEGPSDRIYFRKWLEKVDQHLVEGIHYSIMFYGGALVRHLGGREEIDQDSLQDFIDLKALNQNMAIILDSDKDSPRAALKPAVQRLRDELEDTSSIVWITKGREVENYVDPEDLHTALSSIHPSIYKEPMGTGPYDHAFYFKRSKKNPKARNDPYVHKTGDKVKAATLVCKKDAKLNILDLRERVEEVAAMIRKANTQG